MVDADQLAAKLREHIDSHFEWLLVRAGGRTFPLRRNEIDVSIDADELSFGLLDDSGFGSFRIVSAFPTSEGLGLEIVSHAGDEIETIELVPRTSARELGMAIEVARLERANMIAAAVCKTQPGTDVTRIALHAENGRLAQIFAKDNHRREFAVMMDVTATMIHEALMTSALQWSEKLKGRKKPINELWIVAEKKQARPLQKLLGLLDKQVAHRFRLFQVSNDSESTTLRELSRPPLSGLWRERAKRLSLPESVVPSELAQTILDLSPANTDVIFSRQGETIRFNGLTFARVRTVAGRQSGWFGVGQKQQLLTDETRSQLDELIADLETYRSGTTPNVRHELYRVAPEAWLESIFRRNVKFLDANLILSPIYNQFRAAADKIDLLAIRRDGRLVIIELKASPDREMVFQAADYWRKIELQRRRGDLAQIRAFGDREILDKPALVYAVAPALSFHRDFGYFAAALREEIEFWRFELHQSWRSEIKVLTRWSTSEKS